MKTSELIKFKIGTSAYTIKTPAWTKFASIDPGVAYTCVDETLVHHILISLPFRFSGMPRAHPTRSTATRNAQLTRYDQFGSHRFHHHISFEK
jgi:hypothetical protein